MAFCLPPEISELVLDNLTDDNDLRACALLSSHFLPLARRRLFADLVLLPLQVNACSKLLHLLAASPDLVHYITRLTIIDGTLFPSLTISPSLGIPLTSPQYHSTRDKLNRRPWLLTTPSNILSSLFETLSSIQSFSLIFQAGPKISWDSIPTDVKLAFTHLFTSTPSLRVLHFQRLSWDSPQTFHEFTNVLARAGNVNTLKLRTINPNLLSTTTGSQPTPFAKPLLNRQAASTISNSSSFSPRVSRAPLKSFKPPITSCSSCPSDNSDVFALHAGPTLEDQDPDTLFVLKLADHLQSTLCERPHYRVQGITK